MDANNIFTDDTDDDLNLNLDLDIEEKFADIPSPDGSRNFTTIKDMFDTVIRHAENSTHVTKHDNGYDPSCTIDYTMGSNKQELNTYNGVSNMQRTQAVCVVASATPVGYSVMPNAPALLSIQYSSPKQRDIFSNMENEPTDNIFSDTINQNHQANCFGINHAINRIDGPINNINKTFSDQATTKTSTFNDLIPTTVETAALKDHTSYSKPTKIVHPHHLTKCKPMQPKRQVAPAKHTAPTRKTIKQKNRLLWHFLLDVLHNKSHNPSILTWIDFTSGTFKIVQSDLLAKLWGTYRNKKTGVKYAFFARAMRHYYRQNILRRVPGKKLIYQFGEKVNWKTSVAVAGMPRKRTTTPR